MLSCWANDRKPCANNSRSCRYCFGPRNGFKCTWQTTWETPNSMASLLFHRNPKHPKQTCHCPLTGFEQLPSDTFLSPMITLKAIMCLVFRFCQSIATCGRMKKNMAITRLGRLGLASYTRFCDWSVGLVKHVVMFTSASTLKKHNPSLTWIFYSLQTNIFCAVLCALNRNHWNQHVFFLQGFFGETDKRQLLQSQESSDSSAGTGNASWLVEAP